MQVTWTVNSSEISFNMLGKSCASGTSSRRISVAIFCRSSTSQPSACSSRSSVSVYLNLREEACFRIAE